MDKDLPNIYKGVVNSNNNQDKSVLGENIEKKEDIKLDKNIDKEINKIFNSKDFIYKAEVLITLNNNENIKKTIIGKNNNSLITLDDELIDINNISKIDLIQIPSTNVSGKHLIEHTHSKFIVKNESVEE